MELLLICLQVHEYFNYCSFQFCLKHTPNHKNKVYFEKHKLEMTDFIFKKYLVFRFSTIPRVHVIYMSYYWVGTNSGDI